MTNETQTETQTASTPEVVHAEQTKKAPRAKTAKFKSSRGATYTVRAKDKNLPSVSAVIRSMAGDGFTKGEINRFTGIRYQHVNNVLATPLKT